MPDASLNGIEFKIKGSADSASSSIDKLIDKLTELASVLSTSSNKAGKSAKKAIEPIDEEVKDLIRSADKATVLKAKLDGLRKSLESAFKAGNEKQAWGIRGQILSAESALDKARQTALPVSDKLREMISSASQVDILEAKLQSLRAAMNQAFEEGNTDKALGFRERILRVESALEKLKSAADSTKDSVTPLSVEMQSMISSASQIDILEAKLESLQNRLQEAFNSGDAEKAYSLREQIIRLEDALEKARAAANKTAPAIKDIGKAAKSAQNPLSNIVSSLKRIAFYRIIRGVIKSITQAFQEGLKNAYEFSKVTGDQSGLAAALDTLATKSLTMKNQLGAAFGHLLTAITPIVVQLIGVVTKLAEAISLLFSMLGGNSTYLRAKDVWTEWGEAAAGAGGAAKKALEYLAPFDELNVLPDPKSGGGGGGAAANIADMFEYADVPQKLQAFADSFKISFNDVLFDWKDLTGEQIVEKVIASLGGLLGAGIGFMIGGVPGAITGALIGVVLGISFDALVFDHDGVLSEAELKTSMRTVLNAFTGGVLGFIVGGPGGALIGATVGFGISLATQAIDLIPGMGTMDKNELLSDITTVMTTVVGGVIGFTVGGPGGALIGAAIGFGISAVLETISFSSGGTDGKTFWERFWNDFLEVPQTIDWVERAITWVGEGIADFFNEVYSLLTGHDDAQVWGRVADEWAENASEIVNGFLNGIADKFNNFIQWAKTNIFDPIVDGIKSVFGINSPATEMVPLGEMLSEGIKEGIANAWKNIKNWLITNVYNPLATAWNDLVGEDSRWALPIKAEVEEIGMGSTVHVSDGSDLVAGLGGGVGMNLTGNITSLGDNLSAAKKTINGVTAGINKVADSLTTDQKTVSTIADFTKKTDSLTDSTTKYGRQIATTARFTKKTDGLTDSTSQYGRQLSTIARFTSQKSTLSEDQRTFTSWANFKARKQGLTEDQRTFTSWANFSARKQNLSESQRTFSSWAKFTDYQNNLGTPLLNSNAYINDYRIDNSIKYSGYLSVGAYLNIKGQTNTPTVTVNAQYTNQEKAMGGAYYGNSWHDIPQYASGGRPHGSLFLAGEAGAELVGHVGGRTEVLNQSQLAATMYSAVRSAMASTAFRISATPNPSYNTTDGAGDEDALYRAFRRALDETDFGGDIELDGNTLYRAMVNRNRQNTRLTGVNAMA